MTELDRRGFLTGLAALGLFSGTGTSFAKEGLRFGDWGAFSFDKLVKDAEERAWRPYDTPTSRDPKVLDQIDFDQHWKIKYRSSDTLDLAGGKAPIRFFPLGRYFQLPVTVNVVDGERSREVLYDPALFEMPDTSPARKLPHDIGFAGFRVLEPGRETDWLAFLGGCYFRTSGEEGQFGMSARALALDVAMPTPEEFPRFTDFYLAPSDDGRLVVYTSLDSARMTGAMRMDIAKDGAIVMDIDARFFARDTIQRVGLAPLTSMFWYSETDRLRREDWRPEVHDSDGLAMWTGAGERIWRPLNNPQTVFTSSFADQTPKGFGLLQRDRNFANYEDDGVFYEKRAGVWVEPKGDWGRGAVQLVEIPTDDEIHDNIAAYWVAETPVKKGDAIAIGYKLTWSSHEPHPPEVGRVVATRLGRGGIPGQPRPAGVTKVVIDFDGGKVAELAREDDTIEVVVSASEGKVGSVENHSIKVGTGWRATFDFTPGKAKAADLRLYLKKGDETLTETWLYQFHAVDTPTARS